MGTHRTRAVLAAVLGLCTLHLVVAGPAAADHTVDVAVSGTGCTKGVLAFAIPTTLVTERSVVRTRLDGSTRATCHFKGVPERVEHPDFEPWDRPARATRLGNGICSLHGDGAEPVFGSGTALVTPAGTLKVECLFPPPATPPVG